MAVVAAKPKPVDIVPPSMLSDAERTVWDTVLNNIEPGWITLAQLPLLVAYCRHIVSADRHTDIIRHLENEWMSNKLGDIEQDMSVFLKNSARAHKMRETETRSAISIATKLRITNQALRSSHSNKPTIDNSPKPWQG